MQVLLTTSVRYEGYCLQERLSRPDSTTTCTTILNQTSSLPRSQVLPMSNINTPMEFSPPPIAFSISSSLAKPTHTSNPRLPSEREIVPNKPSQAKPLNGQIRRRNGYNLVFWGRYCGGSCLQGSVTRTQPRDGRTRFRRERFV